MTFNFFSNLIEHSKFYMSLSASLGIFGSCVWFFSSPLFLKVCSLFHKCYMSIFFGDTYVPLSDMGASSSILSSANLLGLGFMLLGFLFCFLFWSLWKFTNSVKALMESIGSVSIQVSNVDANIGKVSNAIVVLQDTLATNTATLAANTAVQVAIGTAAVTDHVTAAVGHSTKRINAFVGHQTKNLPYALGHLGHVSTAAVISGAAATSMIMDGDMSLSPEYAAYYMDNVRSLTEAINLVKSSLNIGDDAQSILDAIAPLNSHSSSYSPAYEAGEVSSHSSLFITSYPSIDSSPDALVSDAPVLTLSTTSRNTN